MMHVQCTCTRAVERCNRERLRYETELRCSRGVGEVQESSCDSLACHVLEVRGQSSERGDLGERGERGQRAVFRLAFY